MTRYHYRTGVSLDKKRSRWFLILISIVIIAAAMYVIAVYLSPRLVTVPFTRLTPDAVGNKIHNSKAGQYGDWLFLPQINVDVALGVGGDKSVLSQGAWQRNPALGDPAVSGNVAISARKFTFDVTPQWTRAKSPFFNLGEINLGDQLTLDYKGVRYLYKVDKRYNVSAGDTSVEKKTSDQRLTLYAVDNSGTATSGVVVEAALISPVHKQVQASDDVTTDF